MWRGGAGLTAGDSHLGIGGGNYGRWWSPGRVKTHSIEPSMAASSFLIKVKEKLRPWCNKGFFFLLTCVFCFLFEKLYSALTARWDVYIGLKSSCWPLIHQSDIGFNFMGYWTDLLSSENDWDFVSPGCPVYIYLSFKYEDAAASLK